MRKNILLVFICSIFLFPIFVKADTGSPFLPNNNFNIIEFDKRTNQPKLVDPSESAKKVLEDVRKAREAKESSEKKEAEGNKLTYENYKSKMSDLTSKVYFEKKFFGFDSNTNYFFNAIVQAIFWLSKFIFGIMSGVYSAVEGMSDISALLDQVVSNSSKVFSSLFGREVVYIIGASMAVYLLYVFATGGSFLKTLIKMLLIYTLIGIYFIKFDVNGQNKYLLTHVYDSFRTTTISLNGEITKTLTSEDKDGIETYFNETIIKAYKYMNSPLKEDGSFLLSEKEFEDLASYKQGDGEHTIGDKKIKDIAKDKDPENKMLKNEWGAKFSYAFASVVDVFVMGIIYLFLGLSRLFFLLVYIFMIVMLPFILIIGLFPKMEHLIHGFNKKAISMLILSSVMLLGTTLFTFFYNTLTNFISFAVGGNLLVTVFMKAILLFLMWHNRGTFMTMFSRFGRLPIHRINYGINPYRTSRTIKERVYQTGKEGLVVGGQFAKGGLKMGRDSLQGKLKTIRNPSINQEAYKENQRNTVSYDDSRPISRTVNRVSTIKAGTRGTVSALKERGNRAMAFLYQVRANSFKDPESDKFKALDSKKDSFLAKAESQGKIKNSSREEVKRLKEKRMARKKTEFQAKNVQKKNQVNTVDKVLKKSSKKESRKNKKMEGGNNNSSKKELNNKQKNRLTVKMKRKKVK